MKAGAFIKTYKYRVKNNIGLLNKMAREVNYVFNYCNETQKKALQRDNKNLTGFDLAYLTAGSSKFMLLQSNTIGAICVKYAQSRKQHKKPWLKWRSKKHTGWVPFRSKDLKTKANDFVFGGKVYKVFKSRELPIDAKIKDGSNFSQDSRGRWYLNVSLEIPIQKTQTKTKAVGIDLGLKDFATLSDGRKFSGPKSTQAYAKKLASAQRANKRKLALKIHDKIKNTRKDFHHKLSSALTKEYDQIVVGDVSPAKLVKTKMAKSVLDSGWYSFKQMLAYKSVMNGVRYVEVNENYSTQCCSTCGSLPESRPRGIASLGIREWVCSDCGCNHDRDVNAAKNILRYGHIAPVEGDAAKFCGIDVNMREVVE